MALLVFGCLNAWRLLMVDALCRLLWRQLFAGHFEFIANCDDSGAMTVTRKQLLMALRAAVHQHARSGWILLGAACAVNVPWMLALRYVGDHLAVGVPT